MEEFMKMAVAAVLFGLILAGCGSLDGIFDYGSSAYADSYSSGSEQSLTYYFWNESSHEVTVWDSLGNTVALSANGGSASGTFNKNVSITDVRYTPAEKVWVYRSDFTHVTFRDK
jgi:ABC-type glycerol-3-phosphate transport system substrate-binding protein